MRKNRLIALIGTLTMAAAGLAAVSAGISSKKAESVSAANNVNIYITQNNGYKFLHDFYIHAWGAAERWAGTTKAFTNTDGDDVYVATIDAQGETGFQIEAKNSNESDAKKYSVNIDISNLVNNKGFYFSGWSGSNMTVGTWDAQPFTISFSPNGGSGSMSNLSCFNGKQNGNKITKNVFTRSGYNFTGWNTSSDGTGTSYNDEGTISNGTYTSGSHTLYAQWEKVIDKSDGFYVYVNNNDFYPMSGISGGVSATVDFSLNDQFKVVYVESKKIKEYYGFDVANKSETKACNSTVGQIGQDTSNQDLKVLVADTYTVQLIYATSSSGNNIDIPRRHQVTFITDGTEVGNPTYRVDYDSLIQPQTSTKTGYSLNGWSTVDGQWNFSSWKVIKDSTLTAIWSTNSHTLTWITDGDELTGNYTRGTVAYGTTIVEPNTPTKTGYVFKEWSSTVPATMPDIDVTLTATWNAATNTQYLVRHYLEDLTGGTYTLTDTDNLTGTTGANTNATAKSYTGFTAPNTIVQESIAADGSTVININYTRNSHSITWTTVGDALTGNYTSGTVAYGTTIVEPNTPTRTGYTFKSWSSTVPTTMPDNDVTLAATWNPTTYTITFNNNGGILATGYKDSFTIEDATFNLPSEWAQKPTADKIFDGWYLEDDFSGTAVTNIPQGSYGNKEFFAKWSDPVIQDVTVTYHDDSGDRAVTGQPGSEISVPTITPRVGHNAVWAENLTEFPNASKTINGVYTPIKYPVVFKNYDGTTILDSQNVDFGTTPIYGGATPTKPATAQHSYTWTGWDNEIVPVPVGGSTYIATFSESVNKYQLSYVDNGGTRVGGVAPGSYDYGTLISLPSEMSKLGYYFDGWFTEDTFDNQVTGSFYLENNVTLYAKFTKIISVQYMDGSTLVENQLGRAGQSLTAPAVPTLEGYDSTWDKQLTEFPDVDTVVNAVHTIKTFDAYFYNGDQLLYTAKDVVYNSTPSYGGETPTKTDPTGQYTYSFTGWTPELGPITSEQTYSATFSQTENQHTITIINSDERHGQTTFTDVWSATKTFDSIESIFGNDFHEPLGRSYVGLKENTSDEEVIQTVEFKEDKTYFACYAFDDANAYSYSFDGNTYLPFTSHNDCEGGELQAYNVTIDSVTAGDTLYVKYGNNVVTLSSDGNSNLSTGNKVNNTTTNVTLNLFLIYSNGEYVYKPVLSGMPTDGSFHISVNGQLSPLSYHDGSSTKEQYSQGPNNKGIYIEEGQIIDAYCNAYYQPSLDSGINRNLFDINSEGKIECKQSGYYDVYLKSPDDGYHYNVLYMGYNANYEAELFADAFLKDVGGKCKNTENINDGKRGQYLDSLVDSWESQRTAYNSLSDAAKSILVNSDANKDGTTIEKFASLYDYTVTRYSGSDEATITPFMEGRKVTSGSRGRLISVKDVSNSTWIIAAVAMVGIAATGVFFIYKKRKEN